MTDSDFKTDDSTNDAPPESDAKVHGKNAVEWTVFAFSCVLVTLVVGYLLYLTLSSKPETATPRLRVTLGQWSERNGHIWVPVTVENNGSVTAVNVEVKVERTDGQSAGFTLPHVPRRGKREGWVSFAPPLKREQLKARISGYQAP